VLEPEEFLEDPLSGLAGDAGTGVRHGDLQDVRPLCA
jgi:hypothetical protein